MELDSIEEVKEEEEDVKAVLSNLLPDLLTQVGINNGAVHASSTTEDTTQSLIDEVETHLQSVSGGVSTSSLEQSWATTTSDPVKEEVDEADRIFEALTTSDPVKKEVDEADR